MSHFVVIVTGDDIESQLQPFHEFECTGTDDAYVRDVDLLPEARVEYAKEKRDGSFADWAAGWYGLDLVPVWEVPDVTDKHKYGHIRVTADSEPVAMVQRTNPDHRWDWWQTGGRWTGFLHSNGGRTDTGLKSQISLDAVRQKAGDDAANLWDRVHAAIGEHTLIPWATIRDQHGDDIEAARLAYRRQPAKEALIEAGKADRDLVWVEDDVILATREEYRASAVKKAGVPFALLHDGVWHEKGSMGWFGCVSGEQEDWPETFWRLWDELPSDTPLTVVDCHT